MVNPDFAASKGLTSRMASKVVPSGGLERTAAVAALNLLGWTATGKGGQLGFWLGTTPRLDTLLDAAKGLSSEFDALVSELRSARGSRNQIVHVATGWHDWESPDEPSGWHYENPRSGSRVYLGDPGTRPALERALASIEGLDDRLWGWHIARTEPPTGG